MINTLSLLDQLTASINTTLTPTLGGLAALTVTTKNFTRAYNITGYDNRPSVYSRYAVHVIGTQGKSVVTAIMTDYGPKRRDSAVTQKVQLDLGNMAGCVANISQFLLSGVQG